MFNLCEDLSVMNLCCLETVTNIIFSEIAYFLTNVFSPVHVFNSSVSITKFS